MDSAEHLAGKIPLPDSVAELRLANRWRLRNSMVIKGYRISFFERACIGEPYQKVCGCVVARHGTSDVVAAASRIWEMPYATGGAVVVVDGKRAVFLRDALKSFVDDFFAAQNGESVLLLVRDTLSMVGGGDECLGNKCLIAAIYNEATKVAKEYEESKPKQDHISKIFVSM